MNSSDFVFRPVSIEDRPVVDSYMYRFGDNSCQHSFTAMFCMRGKYGDSICLKEGFLYTLRAGKSSPGECCCLFPMGDCSDRGALRTALGNLLDYAHGTGRRLRFETVTGKAAALLDELLPGVFEIRPERDMFEYIYSHDRLAMLPGSEMASKRHDVSTFLRDWGDSYSVSPLLAEDIPSVLAFQKVWLEERLHDEEDVQLELENEAIIKGLAYFTQLNLSGIITRIGGEICGYAYGVPISGNCYDVLIEKGDRRFADIYKMLNRDLVRYCCGGFDFINREEDVGVEGIRKAKLSYKPDILLEKYIAEEAVKS